MMHIENNIFTMFVKLLGVKHTSYFSNKYFEEHPYKNSLYGLSKMLNDYRIENMSLKFDQKNNDQLLDLPIPFIAHTYDDFILIYKMTNTTVCFYWNGKDISIPIDEFYRIWTGVVLVAEADDNISIEPNYHEHYKKMIYENIQKVLLILLVLLLFIVIYLKNNLYQNFALNIFLLLNLTGFWVSNLLLTKQIYRHSHYGDRICSLFKQSDCNNILDTNAAKMWGTNITWSEIGLGYFFSNIVISIFVPMLFPYVYFINILILPYSFWSVWYQKVKINQWCLLCLIVQVVIWLVFLSNIFFNNISLPVLSLYSLVLVASLYLIPLFLINRLSYFLENDIEFKQTLQALNSLKAKDDVFYALLKNSDKYYVDKNTSHIVWGNLSSKIQITILTNPYCSPCAKVHEQIRDLLNNTDSNNFFVQYIFSSFTDELKDTNRFLISAYQNNDIDRVSDIYNEWYKGGNRMKEKFFDKYGVVIDEKSLKEYENHERWIREMGLNVTPTILINGYKLPNEYDILDLKCFLHMDLD